MNFVKAPPPRQLSQQETLDTLEHWKGLFRNYYKRDSMYKQFLRNSFKWNSKQPNYGLTAQDDETAEDRAEDLTDFLHTLAGFLPHSYLTRKIVEDSTCLQDCWDIVYEHYNAQVTPETLLDFEKMNKQPSENYRQFYDRLLQHVKLHLAQNGAKVENMTNTSTDTVTISLMNLVALQWLRKCHPDLIDIVRKEYSIELKNGTQLAALVPKIARSIESLLNRYGDGSISLIQTDPTDAHVNQLRFQKKSFITKPAYGRGKFSRNSRGGRSDFFCPGCFTVGKELKVAIDFKHKPEMCPRLHAVSRYMQADMESEMDDDSNDDAMEVKSQGGNSINILCEKPSIEPFQNETCYDSSFLPRHTTPCFINSQCNKMSDELKYQDFHSHIHRISDNYETMNVEIRKLEERKHLWSEDNVRKEVSPSVKATLNGLCCRPIIDEGSEVNCISEEFALATNTKQVKTSCSTSSADSSRMKVVGQTKSNILISILHNKPIVWNLGKCVIIRNLSVQILVGEPGKYDNGIITLPHLKKIQTKDMDGNSIYLDYSTLEEKRRYICKVTYDRMLLPNDSFSYKLPPHLDKEISVAISPLKDKDQRWLSPEILQVNEGCVSITNKSCMPILLTKNVGFADIVRVVDVSSEEHKLKVQKILKQSQEKMHLQQPKNLQTSRSYVEDVQIDPDKQLSTDWRMKFRNLCMEYSDIINPSPGRYNGFYGEIDNSIDFLTTPPPSVKARLPHYSTDKLKIMAKLMDDLENMGVLSKPEDVGVSPSFVVPSLLMPKPEKGEWRLVSDFTPLNIHIRKYQNVSPTIQEAKKLLAKYRYNIECDLSHYFFQGGMKKEDIQYLATPHPYKGLRVYCVEPQGLRNASEHAYERLARIFGDLCMEERMTRMADGLFILADTVADLYGNFSTVLQRAKNAGLTFKPKKIIIAPRETVLFGWKKVDDGWSPTNHTISPLLKAHEPSTVKQLRSFLGSIKQLTECIKDYAAILSPLEQAVAGKSSSEKLCWTEELSKHFQNAKDSLEKIETVHVPKPSDKLEIYTDYSQSSKAIGGRLLITRTDDTGSCRKLLGGHFSCMLNSHQKNWLPCEGEALGVKLVARHFSPLIMENDNITTIYTGNLPTVHAWRRLKTGAFSTSARVASFLTGVSALRVEIVHKPGEKMTVSDYNSRHPNSCSDHQCKVCQFAFDLQKIGNEAIPMVCSISVADIENGTIKMPFTQRAAWAKVQSEDAVHKMLYKLIETSGTPERKKTTGDYTKVKRLHNLFRNGQLKIDSDGLTTISHIDGSGNESRAISVPQVFFPGLVQSLHIKLQHPSKAQMQRLISRYFYCSGFTRIINDIVSNCDVCRSLQDLPKELFSESTTENPIFGRNYSADVIKKDGQLIFICREKLSQFTLTKFIPDESADSLRDAIVSSILEFIPESGAVVQVDCATGLQSLATESKLDGTILSSVSL